MALADRLALVALAACAHASPVATRIAARAEPDAKLVVLDVATGDVIATHGDIVTPVLPLSVIKVYTVHLWWQRGLGEQTFDGYPIDDILVQGYDRAGAALATELRNRVGARDVIAELQRLGVTVTLPPDADDQRWGTDLSIGERDLSTTLPEVAHALRALALGGDNATRRLLWALRATVERGTARGADAALAGTGWQLAGKTGTGPYESQPHDGWFAGLAIDHGRPRYAIAVYMPHRGAGGGAAATLAADVARILVDAR